MKKLSVLIALVLCVTIGGVYAAWNYSQGTTASVDVSREINMAQVVTSGNKGTITATPENNFAFLVDDKGGYVAQLVGTGDILINFAANPGADQSTKDNGIKMIATITLKTTTQSGLTYDDPSTTDLEEKIVPIAVKTGTNANVIVLNDTNADGQPDPCEQATITAAQIVSCLDLAKDLILDTKAENDAFHTALKDYTIVITISEVA